jgi:uncharacterized BrkB/YihY/UPF0761 family membrane protein
MASRTATRQGRIASTVRRDGVVSIAQGSVRRFLNADGTSHTRALAYQFVFVLVSGFIGLIGLASVLGVEQLRLAVQHMAGTLSPGASGRILQRAAAHGASNGGTAAFFGLAAALTAGTLAMAQVERSANRLADDDDPPAVRRFTRAFVLALSAGLLLVIGGLMIGGGRAIETGLGLGRDAATIWAVARWPLGVVVVGSAIYLLFREAPRRPVRPRRAMWVGVGVTVVLWVAFTAALALYLSVGGGQTYGSLIAFVALLLWAVLTSLALHLGFAVAYEFESRIRPGSVRLPESKTA